LRCSCKRALPVVPMWSRIAGAPAVVAACC
jgi:hypothetical protein